ncbi:MAG TPA: hypothetical protein VF141_06590 [Chryseolinea sp.]
MTVCKTCGVELDEDMDKCPLCNRLTGNSLDKPNMQIEYNSSVDLTKGPVIEENLMHRVLWQIAAVLLISGIISTVIIDLSFNGTITWSIYPLSICLILLSYSLVMAWLKYKYTFKFIAGCLVSAIILVLLHLALGVEWLLQLALPILCTAELIGLGLSYSIKRLNVRGTNVMAVTFMAIALLCIVIEALISRYINSFVRIQWSVVVAASLLPVTATILFMYFRRRKNMDIQKVFHT